MNAETVKINTERIQKWLGVLNQNDARIFLAIGMKQGGGLTLLCDDALPKEQLVKELRKIADTIEGKNIS